MISLCNNHSVKNFEIGIAAGKTGRSGGNAAFLLAQIGSHAAARFAVRLQALELSPAQVGILRILSGDAGMTQQALAAKLEMVPSRLVALLDSLEERGLTERRRNAEDRRSHALHLTEQGRRMLGSIGEIARQHQTDLLASLTAEERELLETLLQRVADEQGLRRQVHPGYRTMAEKPMPRGGGADSRT